MRVFDRWPHVCHTLPGWDRERMCTDKGPRQHGCRLKFAQPERFTPGFPRYPPPKGNTPEFLLNQEITNRSGRPGGVRRSSAYARRRLRYHSLTCQINPSTTGTAATAATLRVPHGRALGVEFRKSVQQGGAS